MLRYLRLDLHFLRFSTSRALEFRLDFFMRIVMDCVYYAVNLSFFRLLYLQVPTLGGLTEPQAMLFVRGENYGISHNPLESSTNDDIQLAVEAFARVLDRLAEEQSAAPARP